MKELGRIAVTVTRIEYGFDESEYEEKGVNAHAIQGERTIVEMDGNIYYDKYISGHLMLKRPTVGSPVDCFWDYIVQLDPAHKPKCSLSLGVSFFNRNEFQNEDSPKNIYSIKKQYAEESTSNPQGKKHVQPHAQFGCDILQNLSQHIHAPHPDDKSFQIGLLQCHKDLTTFECNHGYFCSLIELFRSKGTREI